MLSLHFYRGGNCFVCFLLYGDIIRMVTILGTISTKMGVKQTGPSLFGKLIIMGDKVLTPKFPKCLRGPRLQWGFATPDVITDNFLFTLTTNCLATMPYCACQRPNMEASGKLAVLSLSSAAATQPVTCPLHNIPSLIGLHTRVLFPD